MTNVSTLVFVFWPKIALPKELYGKAHCHDAKSTCQAKSWSSSTNVLPQTYENLTAKYLVDCSREINS
jgi:hypothetical protein